MSTIIRDVLIALLVLCTVMLINPSSAYATNDIQIDGDFDDWDGQAHVTDPYDTPVPWDDIVKFSWASNDGDERLYFMFQHRKALWENENAHYTLHLDINDNGIYHNGHDRYLVIDYYETGYVGVKLYSGNDKFLKYYSGFWGELGLKGTKCEFSVSMNDLGIYPAQSIRMFVHSYSDRVPDSGDIQWSPIPILGKVGLGLVFVAGLGMAVISIKKRKLA